MQLIFLNLLGWGYILVAWRCRGEASVACESGLFTAGLLRHRSLSSKEAQRVQSSRIRHARRLMLCVLGSL